MCYINASCFCNSRSYSDIQRHIGVFMCMPVCAHLCLCVWGLTRGCTACPAGSHQPSRQHYDRSVWSAELEVCLSACVCVCVCVRVCVCVCACAFLCRQARGQVIQSEGYRVIQDRSAFTHLGTLVCKLSLYVCAWVFVYSHTVCWPCV